MLGRQIGSHIVDVETGGTEVSSPWAITRKIRTHDPEKLVEEIMSLVTAWRLVLFPQAVTHLLVHPHATVN